jgi:DNA polymerase zeta
MLVDPSDEAQYGERIPYVIIRGQPMSRLVDRAVSPEEVVKDRYVAFKVEWPVLATILTHRQKRIDALYYIHHVLIPPLERIFNLVGADVKAWFDEMPKPIRTDVTADPLLMSPRKKHREAVLVNRLKIEEHFMNTQCSVCGAEASDGASPPN